MEKLYKQFEESVTKWKASLKDDEFFIARLRLTFYYSITAIVILGSASITLYNTILSNFSQSILDNIFLDVNTANLIINRTQNILLNRFLTIDGIIIILVIVLGFLLTYKTLEPIKSNMQKQKRFIADASHELRTPTAVVISGLEVALNNKKLDFTLAKKTLEDTLDEMREFSKLSNTLLDISKYDVPKCVECEPLDISKLLKFILEKSENLASSKEIAFEKKIMEPPVTILGNKVELSRLFYNILDNAIKYTPPKGNISVSDKIISNKYVVTISDSGVGIPKSIIERIFDPFFRGDKARNADGAGLGLTLSKKIVENHKGTISIKSQENKGTSVTISLPISEASFPISSF
ncbi:MAG: HAMP domain-containing sensor histidine kinase [Candidatus Pacebacteria bacterium]|nr:HAMP domain-containing sensor histidine kinase [Candidatus Paceibacterota bacterium]